MIRLIYLKIVPTVISSSMSYRR